MFFRLRIGELNGNIEYVSAYGLFNSLEPAVPAGRGRTIIYQLPIAVVDSLKNQKRVIKPCKSGIIDRKNFYGTVVISINKPIS